MNRQQLITALSPLAERVGITCEEHGIKALSLAAHIGLDETEGGRDAEFWTDMFDEVYNYLVHDYK